MCPQRPWMTPGRWCWRWRAPRPPPSGAVHDGVAAGLLLAELEDRHGGLGHDHLVLVVQQLDELRDGPGDQDGVVLVVDKVHPRVLQHLQGSGNTSFSAHKRFSYIACIIPIL